uniref:Glycosyltransferase n=2 Tax=Aromatoleum anaerobium TaxID=182180 RepID=A0ABX1PP40_9RHOO
MTQTKLIFVGGVTPRSQFQTAISKSKVPLQFAAENFQWSFIFGIEANVGEPMSLISAPFYGSYPKSHRDWYVRGYSFSHAKGASDYSVGYLNLPVIKNIFKFVQLTRQIMKSISGDGPGSVVFVYSANLPYVAAAALAKRKRSDVKLCVIVPDLPEHPGDCSWLYRAYLKWVEAPIFYRIVQSVDAFVTLTDYMSNALGVPPERCVRVEGMFEFAKIVPGSCCQPGGNSGKVILYTGTLDRRYGVVELIEAFKSIEDQDIELWICGGGSAVKDVLREARLDRRLKYLGLRDRSEVLELQRKADLLINPRNNKGTYNKFSFPSKLIEYMASGTPVLGYPLDGVPQEYYMYIHSVEENESLTGAILRVLSIDEEQLRTRASAARKFVLENKGNIVQTRRVLESVLSKGGQECLVRIEGR